MIADWAVSAEMKRATCFGLPGGAGAEAIDGLAAGDGGRVGAVAIGAAGMGATGPSGAADGLGARAGAGIAGGGAMRNAGLLGLTAGDEAGAGGAEAGAVLRAGAVSGDPPLAPASSDTHMFTLQCGHLT